MIKIQEPLQLGVLPRDSIDDFISVASSIVGGGHSTSSSTYEIQKQAVQFIQLKFGAADNRGQPHYTLIECGDHFHCYIDQVPVNEVDARKSLYNETFLKIAAGGEEFEWRATFTLTNVYDQLIRLERQVSVTDEFLVVPSGLRLEGVRVYRPIEPFDYTDLHPPEEKIKSGYSGTYNSKFEVLIEGTENGKSWPTVSFSVAKRLSKFAAYIAVHLDTIMEFENRIVNKSENPEWYIDTSHENSRVKTHPNATSISITEEIIEKWSSYVDDKTLTESFEMYAEAMKIERKHPSLAHIAYVSAIERIGQELKPPNKCCGVAGDANLHCENCVAVKGASAAYRAALRTVLSQSETKRFFKLSYGKRRSKTVHEAVLHGNESTADSTMHHSLVQDNGHFSFEVERVKKIAREVLLAALDNLIVRNSEQV